MASSVPDILSRIVEHKRAELDERKDLRERWERVAADSPGLNRDFRAALTSDGPAMITEIKKASPSAGLISLDFDPVALAKSYEEGGAAALSVLTDERFFQGSLLDLREARSAVKLPVLRKDFTIDEYHIVEAAAHGADAILLIAAILDTAQMREFRELAARHGMAALVEVHNEEELAPALDSGAEIIGVNNRNLHTFEVTLETSLRLSEKIPDNVIRVSESGIRSADDVKKLCGAGFDAFLVGEHLMRAPDQAAAVRELLGWW